MGQKINPHGLRVGVIKDWDSRWFEKDEKFGDTLVSDYNIRKYLKNCFSGQESPKSRLNAITCAYAFLFIAQNRAW